MKKHLLNYILCPSCKKKLTIKIFKEDNDDVLEGLLICDSDHFFPIIKNIPRMLTGDLRGIIYEQFPDFFIQYKDLLPKENVILDIKKDVLQKKKTSESFGFEWAKFSSMRDEWKKNFDFYFEPVNTSLMKEKIALEIGSGNGRHTFYAAQIFKELISVDLGTAVDVAYNNNINNNNIHFIQADIYNLPFNENFFDFIFCIGVLHHLPSPEDGFKNILKMLKVGGGILIYVYHSFSYKHFNFYLLNIVNFFRNITVRLPHKLLYILCYPIAIMSYVALVLPYKFLFKKIVKNGWPLASYANYSFFVMLNDTFDRFSAPIENRYSEKEILAWYQRAKLKNIKILGGSGWRVFGLK